MKRHRIIRMISGQRLMLHGIDVKEERPRNRMFTVVDHEHGENGTYIKVRLGPSRFLWLTISENEYAALPTQTI